MNDLRVSVIQSGVHWEDISANLAMWEEKIWQIGEATDVILLPEMFTTGFTMNAAAFAEKMNMRTFRWMQQMADNTGALILGSFIASEKDQYLNRLVWMEPGGKFNTYDKRHLFRMANEERVYTPGQHRLVAPWKGWNLCPLVCYDLRFPVWSRNRVDGAGEQTTYDVLLYVANWPEARVAAWDTLLRARAIENQSYVLGVNRIGADGNGIIHNGHSGAIDPKGEILFSLGDEETTRTVSLSQEHLRAYRKAFPAFRDSDRFSIDP